MYFNLDKGDICSFTIKINLHVENVDIRSPVTGTKFKPKILKFPVVTCQFLPKSDIFHSGVFHLGYFKVWFFAVS